MTQMSLGLQSEYVIQQRQWQIESGTDYDILRSPDAPDYYFGNLLALKVPLHRYSRAQWRAHFQQAFRDPAIRHETYVWRRRDDDLDQARIEEFLAADFSFEETHVLSLQRADFRAPAAPVSELLLRPLSSKDDWQQWLDWNVLQMQEEHEPDSLRRYLTGRCDNYQALSRQQAGETMGAFAGQRLVGYAGLYHLKSLGRFQNVFVAPEFRRQSIARSLLRELIRRSPATVQTLCIHADENYHATALYQSLGFRVTERECALCWWPERSQRNDETEPAQRQ